MKALSEIQREITQEAFLGIKVSAIRTARKPRIKAVVKEER